MATMASLCALLSVPGADAEELTLVAARDTTLYFDDDGDLANGAGDFLFSGNGNAAKRALVYFDVASALPAGSAVESAQLTLFMSRTIVPGINNELLRVTQTWGEGPSDAPGAEGAGGASEIGDATWIHTFYDSQLWDSPGGDIEPDVRDAILVFMDQGDYSWGSSDLMVSDVQQWLDDPSSNFGWMLRGPESPFFMSSKRFNSRENPDAATRPRLRIEFTPPPSAPPVEVPVSARSAWLLVTLLTAAGIVVLRRS